MGKLKPTENNEPKVTPTQRRLSLIIEQRIQGKLKENGYKNRLSEIIGKWPGEETYEELIAGL